MDVPDGFRVTVEDEGVYVRLPDAEQTAQSIYQPVLTRGHARRLADWVNARLLPPPIHLTLLRPPLVDVPVADEFAEQLRTALANLGLDATVEVVGDEGGTTAPLPPPIPTAPPEPVPSPPKPLQAPVPTRRRVPGRSSER